MRFLILPSLVAALGVAATSVEASDIRTEQVRFPSGKTGTSIKGRIVGNESVSYRLGAEAGQTMTVVLKPSNGATYFNVYEPGKGPGDQALANGSIIGPMTPDVNRFSGSLPSSGTYTVSVYMMRSAARRNERSNYTLDISISARGGTGANAPVSKDFADGLQGGPDYWEVKTARSGGRQSLYARPSAGAQVRTTVKSGAVLRNKGCRMAEGRRWCQVETIATPQTSGWIAGDFLRESSYTGAPARSQDAKDPLTGFHATGNLPCARYAGQPMMQCRFGVVRKGGGSGDVTFFWPDGGNRVISFEAGKPAKFDQSQADGDVRMTVAKNSDLFTVTIGQQRFEIPEAVIFGG